MNLKLRYRVVKCYVYLILPHAVEAGTFESTTIKDLEAFEIWIFRNFLKILFPHITNNKVLGRRERSRKLLTTIKKKRKLAYLGHIMRHEHMN